MRRLAYLCKAVISEKTEMECKRKLWEHRRKKEKILIKENGRFKDIHKGERCFIIGNGPSLKDIDFSKLKKEITFTVNQLPRSDQFCQLHTNYHLWADERFFNLDENDSADMELLDVMKKVNTENNSPLVFYKTTAKPMIDRFHLSETLHIAYYMDGGIGNELYNIEYPLNRMLPIFSTCIHYAIVIAVYMGFKDIYLLGCDCTGIFNTIHSKIAEVGAFEYAYDISDNEKNRMTRISGQSSIADEFTWYGNLLNVYGILYKYAKLHSCNLYNATTSSIIDNLPNISLSEILN